MSAKIIPFNDSSDDEQLYYIKYKVGLSIKPWDYHVYYEYFTDFCSMVIRERELIERPDVTLDGDGEAYIKDGRIFPSYK